MKRKPRGLSAGEMARRIAALAPPELAEAWDNVGLQVGDPARRVARLMVCLETTASTLAEARRRRADAILAHHPLIFRPLKSLLWDDPAQRLVTELARAGLTLIVAHTNLDAAAWGTNQALAEACGLWPTAPLEPRSAAAPFKLVVFTPQGHESAVIEAIARGGGGQIGLYTHCTFRTPGVGTFRGGEGAQPYIGEAGRLESAEEFRLEAVVPASAARSVLDEVLKVHPYEEPAYEFYPLAEAAPRTGLGCLAELTRAEPAELWVKRLKRKLRLKRVRLAGPLGRPIRRVAICTGSGGGLLRRAREVGAHALLTGEAHYHHGIEAHQLGILLIEVGHFESERLVATPLARRLAADPALQAAGVEVFAATDDLQPFRWV